VQLHPGAEEKPVLVFEIPEERLALSNVQDILHAEDIKVGINGGELYSFALLLIPLLKLLEHLAPLIVSLAPFT